MRNYFQYMLIIAVLIISLGKECYAVQTDTLWFCISPNNYADPQGHRNKNQCTVRCGGHSRCQPRSVEQQTTVGLPVVGQHLPEQSHIVTGQTAGGTAVVAPLTNTQAPIDKAVISMRAIPAK